MTVCTQYVGAVLATAKRDAMIFASYRLRFISQVLAMLFTLTMFNYIAKLVRPNAVGPHGHYYAFVVVGILSTAILTAALSTSNLVRLELMQGNFERVVISPLGPVGGAISVAVFPVAYSVLFSGLMLGLAAGVFGIPLHLVDAPAAIAVATLGALAFASIGLLFVAGLLAYKSAAGTTWVLAALALLGGAYFPIRLFPGSIRWASNVQPFTPAVDLLRHVLVGAPSAEPVWLDLTKLAGFAAVLMPASAALLWLAVNVSRRRGTLMEY